MNDLADALENYPVHATDKLRYRDCDAQGHVNNAVYSTFLETARTEMLYLGDDPILDSDCGFVIARLELDFMAETHWPGSVETGTRVLKIGNSSVTMQQALFQNGVQVARAKTILVQINQTTRKAQPLSQRARQHLQDFT